MAVTGSGTVANPWMVHDYYEIKDTIGNIGNNQYIKLANDIDCRDYGTAWKWETIEAATYQNNYTFDLDGHTIKNLTIANDNLLFSGFINSDQIIKNGVIKNVFNDRCQRIMNAMTMNNIGMSVNINNIPNSAFGLTKIDCCAIRLEAITLGQAVFKYRPGYIRNSDFLININGNNEHAIFESDTNITDPITGCRVVGTIANCTPVVTESTGNDTVGLIGNATDSVISLSFPDAATGARILLFSKTAQPKGTIVDMEKLLDTEGDIDFRYTGIITCATHEMDASIGFTNPTADVALNNKGFAVAKVGD